MKYVGLQSQIRRNNTNSLILLLLFPLVLYGLTWVFLYFTGGSEDYDPVASANSSFMVMFPWVTAGVAI